MRGWVRKHGKCNCRLGDRKGIANITEARVGYMRRIRRRGITIFAYANNHYSGHGPATIAIFLKLWNAKCQ